MMAGPDTGLLHCTPSAALYTIVTGRNVLPAAAESPQIS